MLVRIQPEELIPIPRDSAKGEGEAQPGAKVRARLIGLSMQNWKKIEVYS